MKFSLKIRSLSIEDSNIIKGVGILLIAFHNFFHWVQPRAKENEFDFKLSGIHDLVNGISNQPLESINLLFSFWGHFGVQLFIFISGYGLMKAYKDKQFSWGSFVSKRINKLWPTFFFAIFLFYSLFRVFYMGYSIELGVIKEYLLRISFLSNFIPNKAFSLSGPWWFYSMIVQLYLIFPLLLIIHKRIGNYALVLFSALMYLVTYIFNPWFVEHGSSLYFFFVANIPVFVFGMILGSKKETHYNHLIGIGALILFTLGNFYYSFWYFSHLMFTIIGLVIIYQIFLKSKGNSIFYKTILFYGEISMYFFAVHGFLRTPFIELSVKYNHPLMTIVWSIGFIILSTIVALALKLVVSYYSEILKFLSDWSKSITSKIALYLINGLKSIMQICTVFLFLLISLRIYEYLLLHYHHEMHNIDIYTLIDAIFRDLLIGIGFIGFLTLPYLILYRLSKAIARSVIYTFITLVVFINIGLIQYYDFTLIPLDRVIYAYSWKSIYELSNTTEYNILTIFPFIISFIGIGTAITFSNRLQFKRVFIIIFPFIAFFLAITHNNYIPKEYKFENEEKYYYTNNKLLYFIKDIIRYKPTEELNLAEIGASINDYREVFKDRNYLSLNYPFLRVPDQGDPIGSYFNKTNNSRPPNIVIIIVESLCTPVSGPYSYKSSFTPFLDSLTEHSLYWRNNVATSERTFGVLPSILASLPYGKKGFLNLNLDMPEHKSLINILKKNDYTSRFFYGGWTQFNNMNIFMELNQIDSIINQFDSHDSIPPNKNGFSWGYSDRAILQSTFSTIPDSSDSYLSIYLTLSTHSPFMLKNESYYMQRALDHMKTLDISEKKKPGYLKNQKNLATFLYFDDELRNFFNKYKQRKDYENTIFVITGDHRGIIFSRTTQIDVYHTPLIIFSPLLKRAHEFGGVTSHADLTPTFINFLENNYQIETPNKVSWLGGLLDTSTEFHSQKRMAFMRNNRDIRDYINGKYYLASDNLYELSDTMHLKKIYNESIKNQLKHELHDFKNLNQFAFMGLQKQVTSSIEQLVSITYDFEDSIPPFYQESIRKLNASSGNTAIIMEHNQIYGGIAPNLILGNHISRVYIKVSFKALTTNLGSQNPIFVISLGKEDQNIIWEGIDFMNNSGTTNQWITHTISKTLFLNPKDSKGSELKLYLWNQHGTEMYYDDIKIDIKVKKI